MWFFPDEGNVYAIDPMDKANVLLDAITLKPIHRAEGLPPISIAAAIGPMDVQNTPGIKNIKQQNYSLFCNMYHYLFLLD